MRIPEIREAMYALADEPGMAPRFSKTLRWLADELKRRPAPRKAEAVSARITPKLAHNIRAFAVRHPNVTQFEIGRRFRVNQGRVSEVVRGKRH